MSKEGKLRRGKELWDHRDRDDNLPDWIKENESRMADIEFYKDNVKEEKKNSKKGEVVKDASDIN